MHASAGGMRGRGHVGGSEGSMASTRASLFAGATAVRCWAHLVSTTMMTTLTPTHTEHTRPPSVQARLPSGGAASSGGGRGTVMRDALETDNDRYAMAAALLSARTHSHSHTHTFAPHPPGRAA